MRVTSALFVSAHLRRSFLEGATGAVILGTVVDELERRKAHRAVVTLCVGGGMGVATLVERV